MSDDYKPISCELYSQFELWILHQEWIKLAWNTGEMTRIERVRPTDVRAETGVEYLYFHDTKDDSKRVRLDHILEAVVISDSGTVQ